MNERWVIVTTEEDGTQRVLGPSKEDTGRCTYNNREEAEQAASELAGVELQLMVLEELT